MIIHKIYRVCVIECEIFILKIWLWFHVSKVYLYNKPKTSIQTLLFYKYPLIPLIEIFYGAYEPPAFAVNEFQIARSGNEI